MSDDLENAAIDGILKGDFRPVAPLLMARGGLAFDLLAMLMAGGHIRLELSTGARKDIGISTRKAMEYLEIGRFIAEREAQLGLAGENVTTQPALEAALEKFEEIDLRTAQRAKSFWVKQTAGGLSPDALAHLLEHLSKKT